MNRALVLTNHLHAWGGSEVLALEVAEVLSENYQVTLCANVVGNEIYSLYKDTKISIKNNPGEVDLRDFQFIWSQHLVMPLCRGFQHLDQFDGIINSIHLSPYEPFELAALTYAPAIGAKIIANSAETSVRIKQLLKNEVHVENLSNAAPNKFFCEKKYLPQNISKPNNICIVSNHIPSELREAAKLLQEDGINVHSFGVGQKNYKRLTSEAVQNFDAIISIGKTVQYGILSRRPVYCYDRFGGPGYITSSNIKKALAHNFSGRCCGRKLTPFELKTEILESFANCLSDVNLLAESFKDKFSLEKFIEKISAHKTEIFPNSVVTGPIIEVAKLIRSRYIMSIKSR